MQIDSNLKCMLGNKPRSIAVQGGGTVAGSTVAFKKGNIPGELVLSY